MVTRWLEVCGGNYWLTTVRNPFIMFVKDLQKPQKNKYWKRAEVMFRQLTILGALGAVIHLAACSRQKKPARKLDAEAILADAGRACRRCNPIGLQVSRSPEAPVAGGSGLSWIGASRLPAMPALIP